MGPLSGLLCPPFPLLGAATAMTGVIWGGYALKMKEPLPVWVLD
jgi:hypothetical protein